MVLKTRWKNRLAKQQKEKTIKENEESLRNILDNMKCNNIHFMGISKEKRASKGLRTYLKK